MDVVIFAALPFVTDKEPRAPIGRAAQIRPIRPWWSAEKRKLAANILFHRPGGTWRRSTPSPPTLDLIYRPKRSSRDFWHYLCIVRLDLIFAEVWKRRRCTLASDTGDAALRKPSA